MGAPPRNVAPAAARAVSRATTVSCGGQGAFRGLLRASGHPWFAAWKTPIRQHHIAPRLYEYGPTSTTPFDPHIPIPSSTSLKLYSFTQTHRMRAPTHRHALSI